MLLLKFFVRAIYLKYKFCMAWTRRSNSFVDYMDYLNFVTDDVFVSKNIMLVFLPAECS